MNFYKYIYKDRNGYSIKKNNIHYGWYDNIRDALHDRDNLIKCEWDLGEWVYMDNPNPYKSMRLPPYGLNRANQYVYNKDGKFVVKKRINGKYKYFGVYEKLDDALNRRDELLESGWK